LDCSNRFDDIGSDMTQGAPWCANLIELLLSSNTHMLYLVESFKAMEVEVHDVLPPLFLSDAGSLVGFPAILRRVSRD
jgi:hypothetical protein